MRCHNSTGGISGHRYNNGWGQQQAYRFDIGRFGLGHGMVQRRRSRKSHERWAIIELISRNYYQRRNASQSTAAQKYSNRPRLFILTVQTPVSYRSILQQVVPVSLALFLPQISFFTNTAFLGRLGERELGVNGVAGIFFLLLQLTCWGYANGLSAQMARRRGEGNLPGLGRMLAHGAVLALMLAGTLLFLSSFLAPIIFQRGMTDPQDKILAEKFLALRQWGLLPLVIDQVLQAFCIATNRSRALVVSSAVMVAVNVLLDWLLIFGVGGFPAMGLQGAAAASVGAEIAGAITLLGIFFYTGQAKNHSITGASFKLNAQLAWSTLKVSSPLMLQYAFSVGGWVTFFLFVEHMGIRALAASQVLRSIFGLMGLSTWAFAAVTAAMVSTAVGEGRTEEVPALIRKIATLSVGLTALLAGGLFLFGTQFLGLYSDNAEFIAYALPSLHVIAGATIIMSLATVIFNGVVGTGNTRVNLGIEITGVILYLFYCWNVTERLHLSLEWAWTSEFVYWGTVLLLSVLYLRSGKWRGKKI